MKKIQNVKLGNFSTKVNQFFLQHHFLFSKLYTFLLNLIKFITIGKKFKKNTFINKIK